MGRVPAAVILAVSLSVLGGLWLSCGVEPSNDVRSGDECMRPMTAVGFEPTQLALVELESTPLDHSGKLSTATHSTLSRGPGPTHRTEGFRREPAPAFVVLAPFSRRRFCEGTCSRITPENGSHRRSSELLLSGRQQEVGPGAWRPEPAPAARDSTLVERARE